MAALPGDLEKHQHGLGNAECMPHVMPVVAPLWVTGGGPASLHSKAHGLSG
jgi:hypothetical protein